MHPANKPVNVIRRVNRAREFPINTCPASRHVQMIGEALIRGMKYHMIDEEPEHVGGSLLSVVESLFKARTEIDGFREKLGMRSRIDEAMAKPRPILRDVLLQRGEDSGVRLSSVTYPPEMLPSPDEDEEAEVIVVDPKTGVKTTVYRK